MILEKLPTRFDALGWVTLRNVGLCGAEGMMVQRQPVDGFVAEGQKIYAFVAGRAHAVMLIIRTNVSCHRITDIRSKELRVSWSHVTSWTRYD